MSLIRAILLLVPRSLKQHRLATAVTALSVALAVGLVMAVFSIKDQTRDAFTGGPVGFDAVLGARGSQLQLVMNTVFHLETSPGNIPWSLYTTAKNDPGVELAIPYAVGDNYWGFRIVGTTEEIFTKFEYTKGRKFQVQAGGRFFDPARREAVIGATVAARTGLKVGNIFNPGHGFVYDPSADHPEEYVVVGVLEPTNSPSDRVVWIPIEGIFRMTGHVLRGTGSEYVPEEGIAIADEHKEVSAVMLKFRNPMVGMQMQGRINRRGKIATLAWPIAVPLLELFEKIGWVNKVLALIAILVCIVAAFAILASIYNTMNERRREFAILRALGATRGVVFGVVTCEAAAIALLGAILGYGVYAAIVLVAKMVIAEQTGVYLDPWELHEIHYWMPLGALAVGAVAGLIPALKAYTTNVADNLVPQT